jgi:tryptophan-rich sensory protein
MLLTTITIRPSLLYDIPRSLPWAVGLPLLLGSLNGKVTKDNVNTWYPTLRQPPPGPPPRWVFPVVWT